MPEVNTDFSTDPASGFYFSLKCGSTTIARFQDLIISFNSPFEINFSLVKGLIDVLWFSPYIDMSKNTLEQTLNTNKEFEICFDKCNAPKNLELNSSKQGIYTIKHCKINTIQLGVKGRRVVAVKFKGSTSLCEFTPS